MGGMGGGGEGGCGVRIPENLSDIPCASCLNFGKISNLILEWHSRGGFGKRGKGRGAIGEGSYREIFAQPFTVVVAPVQWLCQAVYRHFTRGVRKRSEDPENHQCSYAPGGRSTIPWRIA